MGVRVNAEGATVMQNVSKSSEVGTRKNRLTNAQ